MGNKVRYTGGQCNAKGFIIEYKNRGIKTSKATKDYLMGDIHNKNCNEQENTKVKKFLRTVMLIFIILFGLKVFMNYFFVLCLIPPLSQCVFIFFIAFVFSIADILRFYNQSQWQWHTCEHKLYNLLKKQKGVTIESLKKVRKVSIDCGSFIVFFPLSLIIFITYVGICLETVVNVIRLNCFFSALIGFGLLVFMILICCGSALLMQKIFVLKEPTKEQYEETLRLGKLIEAEIKQNR